jgi:hypothetical protein
LPLTTPLIASDDAIDRRHYQVAKATLLIKQCATRAAEVSELLTGDDCR